MDGLARRRRSARWPALAVALALALGCSSLRRGAVKATAGPPAPPPGTADDPPPLHTGGLGVLGTGPGGVQQGIGPTGPGHGNPVAEAAATGIGTAILGVKAGQTVVDCTRPGAKVECLHGPGPVFEADAGAP
jgi:hypothetical protein